MKFITCLVEVKSQLSPNIDGVLRDQDVPQAMSKMRGDIDPEALFS